MICADCAKGATQSALAESAAGLPRVRKAARLEAVRLHGQCKGGTWCDCAHALGTVLRQDRKPDPRRGA